MEHPRGLLLLNAKSRRAEKCSKQELEMFRKFQGKQIAAENDFRKVAGLKGAALQILHWYSLENWEAVVRRLKNTNGL